MSREKDQRSGGALGEDQFEQGASQEGKRPSFEATLDPEIKAWLASTEKNSDVLSYCRDPQNLKTLMNSTKRLGLEEFMLTRYVHENINHPDTAGSYDVDGLVCAALRDKEGYTWQEKLADESVQARGMRKNLWNWMSRANAEKSAEIVEGQEKEAVERLQNPKVLENMGKMKKFTFDQLKKKLSESDLILKGGLGAKIDADLKAAMGMLNPKNVLVPGTGQVESMKKFCEKYKENDGAIGDLCKDFLGFLDVEEKVQTIQRKDPSDAHEGYKEIMRGASAKNVGRLAICMNAAYSCMFPATDLEGSKKTENALKHVKYLAQQLPDQGYGLPVPPGVAAPGVGDAGESLDWTEVGKNLAKQEAKNVVDLFSHMDDMLKPTLSALFIKDHLPPSQHGSVGMPEVLRKPIKQFLAPQSTFLMQGGRE